MVSWRERSFLIFKEIFSADIPYHASAITFSAFLSSNTFVLFLGSFLKYLPHKEIFIQKIYNLFPSEVYPLVDILVKSIEHLNVKLQIFSFFLVLFFLGNFLKTLEKAFSHLAAHPTRNLHWKHYLIPFFFVFFMLLYSLLGMFIDVLIKFLQSYSFYLGIFIKGMVIEILILIKILLELLFFPLSLWFIHLSLSPVRLNFLRSFIIAFVIALILSPLKILFSWYIENFLIKNLVLTSLAGIFTFLIWLYLIFFLLLLGYRLALILRN